MPSFTHEIIIELLHNGVSVYGIVVETQLQKDPDRLYSWPMYATLLRSRHRCPVDVLVFAGDKLVADWPGSGSISVPAIVFARG